MKRLNKPTIEPATILDACTNSVSNKELAVRLNTARKYLLEIFEKYENFANAHKLFAFDACDYGNETQIVIANISKKELMDLYSNQLVSGNKPGRKFYDGLMMLAPLGKCPFCGFGQVSTLDHFLSKSRYPAFSVFSLNLVPSCSDCNKDKGASALTKNTQILHPYFEDANIETVPWLFTQLDETIPASVKYFVKPPEEWSAELTARVSNHFRDLELAKRFGIEAASELASLSDMLDLLETPEARAQHLQRMSRVERSKRTNSWRAALYEALTSSDWYITIGFRRPNQ
jgi:hypothetical protein